METIAERPLYAQKVRASAEQRLLTFESDGAPVKREFSQWGMEIINAWSDNKEAWIHVANGDLSHVAPCGARIFVLVRVP